MLNIRKFINIKEFCFEGRIVRKKISGNNNFYGIFYI